MSDIILPAMQKRKQPKGRTLRVQPKHEIVLRVVHPETLAANMAATVALSTAKILKLMAPQIVN